MQKVKIFNTYWGELSYTITVHPKLFKVDQTSNNCWLQKDSVSASLKLEVLVYLLLIS